MTYLNVTQNREFGLAGKIALYSKALVAAFERRRLYRRTVAELRALSDHELSDLGISRSMITRVALEATNGK